MTAHNTGRESGGQAKKARAPLYRQVVQALKQDIVYGRYPVDSQLPPEAELRARFNVSRHTIREALRELRDAGLVESRQGFGTTVLRQGQPKSYVHEVASVNDLIELANATRYEVDSDRMLKADRALVERIGGAVGDQWLHIEGFRFAPDDSRPVCWTEVFVRGHYAGVARLIGRRPGPIYQLIEDLYAETIDEVAQRIQIVEVPAEISTALGTAKNGCNVEVQRSYRLSNGEIAEVARNIYPADRFQLAMTMRRSRD